MNAIHQKKKFLKPGRFVLSNTFFPFGLIYTYPALCCLPHDGVSLGTPKRRVGTIPEILIPRCGHTSF
jgi:hypothetical protein